MVFCGNSTDFHCMNGGQCMYDQTAKEYYCKCAPNVRGRHCQFGECHWGAGAWATGVGAGPGTLSPGGMGGRADGQLPTSQLPGRAAARVLMQQHGCSCSNTSSRFYGIDAVLAYSSCLDHTCWSIPTTIPVD